MKKCCWLYATNKLSTYAACFIGKSIEELVNDFNREVGATEVTQDRIYYREALLRAIEEHGVDISAVAAGLQPSSVVCEGIGVDDGFKYPVRFDEDNRALAVIRN